MTFDAAAFLSAIENVDKKIPLPEFCQKLRELGLPLSNSWGKTIGGLQDIAKSKITPADILGALDTLVIWLSDYLIHYSKAVLVFPINPKATGGVPKLAAAFEAGLGAVHILTDHPKVFPGLLSKTEVGGFTDRLVLRQIIKQSDHISFIFTSVKLYQVRDIIPISLDDGLALQKLSGYTKVIAIKTVAHEHIDVVRFRHDSAATGPEGIDLIIDVTKPGASPLNSEEITARAAQYIALIKGAINAANPGVQLPDQLNFFSAMKKIYDSTSGNVCELSFTTTIGGSVKRDKMKKNTADLRSETWHAGGRLAISNAAVPDTIDIYRLGVSWKIAASKDEPILTIPGRYRSLSTAQIDHAVVLGCTERASFDFAFSQLMAFC